MDFRRQMYQRLVQWKQKDSKRVLELSGARQVGKTYLLKKFARENFKQVLYINMAEFSGQVFLKCMNAVEKWEPGTEQEQRPVHKMLQLFEANFQDNKDTIILIDEIQESTRVYNLIRTFARDFECYVAVTGSYLGRLLEKDFFLPAGDIDSLTLETLTFGEICEVFHLEKEYQEVKLYGGSAQTDYENLRELFQIYQRIGGYPSVVATYLATKDFTKCDEEIKRLMDIFVNESKRYFEDVMATNLFDQLFHGIAITLIREKQGVRDLVEEVSDIVYQQESGRITKKMVNHAIGWLQASHIVGYAGKSIDCDYLDIKPNARFYFQDLGVAQYFLRKAGADKSIVCGLLAENFMYLALARHIDIDIAGSTPWFAIYQKTKGELDFFVRSLIDYKNYGIEVKSKDGEGKTARELLKAKKIDCLYYMKGDSQGGIAEDGRVRTVPLYLADRVEFRLDSI